jgi:hypothetical protein
MSRYVFLALCILGTGFMTYVFFQWTYGNKRSTLARQMATHKKTLREQSHRPYLVPSQGPLSHLRSYREHDNRSRPVISAQAAPTTNDSLQHNAMRSCDQSE